MNKKKRTPKDTDVPEAFVHQRPVKSIQPSQNEMDSILTMMEKLLHWAAIVDSSDDAIISKSADGYITSWNRGAQNLYGYTPEEIIGQPVSVLMPPGKKDDFPYIMNMLHEGKKVEHYDTQRITKYGKILDVSITVSPIRDAQGNIIGAAKIARDISQRVEYEKRRDEFINTTSHELKTPITSQKVLGQLLEQLIDRNGDTQYKKYISKINAQTERLIKLVEDLLELSRLQSGRLILRKEIFDFDQLVHEIIDTTKLTTQHSIICKGSSNKKVCGDRDRIGQVITNFLSNAIKYSPQADKIIVAIEAKKGNVLCSVQDFGIGIPLQYQDRIFERFFRVAGVDEKTFPGMGIGMHFSKEVIDRHGGTIGLESDGHSGTTFYFSLPIKVE